MLKQLFLTSSTLLCLTLIADIGGIAKAENVQASQILAHEPQGGTMSNGSMEHPHKTSEIAADQPIPTVNIVIHKDPLREPQLTSVKPTVNYSHLAPRIPISYFRFSLCPLSLVKKIGIL